MITQTSAATSRQNRGEMLNQVQYRQDSILIHKDGKAVAEQEIRTAGKPDHIELVPDRSVIHADGKDLSFFTVKVVDKDGNLCPDATTEISFKVKGAGTYRAGTKGNPASLESFKTPKMKVFSGMMTAIVQSTEQSGKITLEATAKGLKKGVVTIQSNQKLLFTFASRRI